MLNSFTNKVKSIFSSSDGKVEPRKRKRDLEECEFNEGSSIKKPRLLKNSPNWFGQRVLKMTDWLKGKNPNMFSWGAQRSLPPTNGNGYHGQRNIFRKADSGREWLTRPPSADTSHQSQSLCRPPLQSSYSVASQTAAREKPPEVNKVGGQKSKKDKFKEFFHRKRNKPFTATEILNLEEKMRYKEMLQKFTTVPIDSETSAVASTANNVTVRHPVHVAELPRFYFHSNSSILGSMIPGDVSAVEKDVHSQSSSVARSTGSWDVTRQKVQATPRLNTTQSVIHGNGLLLPANKALATSTPMVQTDKARRSIKEPKYTIDLTSDNEDEPEISKLPQKTDNRSAEPLSDRLKSHSSTLTESKYLTDDWIKDLTSRYDSKARERQRAIEEAEMKIKVLNDFREQDSKDLEKKIRQQLHIQRRIPVVVEDQIELTDSEDELEVGDDEKDALPELTEEMENRVKAALSGGSPQEVLVDKFRLQMTRGDIKTLSGLNWLNDEVINFYMNMLMERGENDNFPKVYAFNTFFYPKVMSGGQSAVKRWTRRVDVLAVDYIIVPVHLGIHWCLAIINFKEKDIQYFDSMGGNNIQCLNALKKYLCDESLDKKKKEFDLTGWKTTIMKDIPQQLNGSDCGMFACKFAEYITREAPISFTQEHMPYFRRRMVYEIVSAKLLQ